MSKSTLSSNDKNVLMRIFDDEDFEDDGNESNENTSSAVLVPQYLIQKEIEAIQMAEAGQFVQSLQLFSRIIDDDANYASAYNNRAQVLQLMKRNEEAKTDLDKAVELSAGKGKVGIQALTQRGMIYKLNGCDELAMKDWEKASLLGGTFAKRLIIMNNPYAALCNQMLSKVFKEMRCG